MGELKPKPLPEVQKHKKPADVNLLSNTEYRWFAVYTKYKCEKYVAEHLQKKKIEAYIPLMTRTRRYARKIKQYDVPVSVISIKQAGILRNNTLLQSFLTKTSKEKEMFTIVIRVDKAVLKYIGDQKYYNGFVSQKEAGDKMEMNFVTATMMGFAKFYLLFGEHAEIVSPPELKDMVKKNLEAISKKLSA